MSDVDDVMADGLDGGDNSRAVAADEYRQFIERIERLEGEKKAIADDIREVKAELKGRGFDIKATNQILKLRKKTREERQEEDAMLEIYLQALGMV